MEKVMLYITFVTLILVLANLYAFIFAIDTFICSSTALNVPDCLIIVNYSYSSTTSLL